MIAALVTNSSNRTCIGFKGIYRSVIFLAVFFCSFASILGDRSLEAFNPLCEKLLQVSSCSSMGKVPYFPRYLRGDSRAFAHFSFRICWGLLVQIRRFCHGIASPSRFKLVRHRSFRDMVTRTATRPKLLEHAPIVGEGV